MTRGLRSRRLPLAGLVAAAALIAAACGAGDSGEPLEPAEASAELDDLADEIDWVDVPVTRSASIPPPTGADLADVVGLIAH